MTTKFAWDVPGYVQGHRFSQDERYYDPATGRFRDLAGYDHLGNYVETVTGTPAFSTHGVNSRQGLLLDKSAQFKFLPAIPWQGSALLVIKPTLASASVTHWPWLFGTNITETSNGFIRLNRASGVNNLTYATPSSVLASTVGSLVSGNIAIAAFSTNQEDRIARRTQDGVTITASSPLADAVHGNGMAIASASAAAEIGGVSGAYVRMGDLVGDATTTPNATDYLHVFEQHFWKGDVLRDNATKLAAFIASLREYYGI